RGAARFPPPRNAASGFAAAVPTITLHRQTGDAVMPNTVGENEGAAAVAADGHPDQRKPGLKARAISTGKKTLIMMLYLWAFLAVLNLHKTVVLQQQHIDYNGLGVAIINAVVLVKVMLVADDLKVGTRFRENSLIYHTLYASFWFAVVLVGFHIVEGAVMAL